MANKRRDENKKFKSKHINHDPQTESAKAVFGDPKTKYLDPERER